MRQFCELLPTVKSEFDSLAHEVGVFEALGSDSTVLEQVNFTSARLDILEGRMGDILDVDKVRHLSS